MRRSLSLLTALSLSIFCAITRAATPKPMAVDPAWLVTPKTHDAPGFSAEGCRPLFFDGPPYNGQPTRAFAWVGLPKEASAEKKVPAMVLVHGGGGTAFDAWVRLWTSRGYAAIAMDTCGQVPKGKYGAWERHPQGGPPGWGGFAKLDDKPEDQWTYHAAADVILGHSLLRSMPEVDADRVGLTGISWGGYLTCVVAGLDDRFKLAVPVYGCGFLGDNSTWLGDFQKMGPEKAAKWLAMWDPSQYLAAAKMPMLWVNGTNDFAYPPDSWQKSYRLPKTSRTLSLKVRMPHGHGGAGENPEEIHAFANAILKGDKPLTRVTGSGTKAAEAWATFEAAGSPIARAELVFTRDAGPWQKRKWETSPAKLDADAQRATADVPAVATAYYLNLVDGRGLIVSSEHEAREGPKPPR